MKVMNFSRNVFVIFHSVQVTKKCIMHQNKYNIPLHFQFLCRRYILILKILSFLRISQHSYSYFTAISCHLSENTICNRIHLRSSMAKNITRQNLNLLLLVSLHKSFPTIASLKLESDILKNIQYQNCLAQICLKKTRSQVKVFVILL